MRDERADRIDWRLLLAFWLVSVIGLTLRSIYGGMPLIADTDDAMRLVEVHDFLAGQGWYDLTQYRLDTPYGGSMHWSRLVDLPIALLITVLRPLFGVAAETAAAYAYPFALLLGLLWLSARLSMRFAGPEGMLPGLALPAFSLITLTDFSPGRFDHHSVQVLLLLVLALCTIEALERPRRAIGAGIAAGAAIAIGIESLPGVVSAILAFGLLWVLDGRHATALRYFGLGFGGATLLFLGLALPPAQWFSPACDAISIVYAAPAVGTGLAFVVLSFTPLRTPLRRLAAGVMAGGALVALLVALFPQCLRGPYAALDPWLVDNWLDRIREAQPLIVALGDNPVFVVAVTVPALLALGVAIWQLFAAPAATRQKWITYAAFLVVALLVACIQLRAIRFANCLAVPAGAVLIVAVRAAYLRRAGIGSTAGLVGSWLGFAGVALALLTGLVLAVTSAGTVGTGFAAQPADASCRRPEAFAALALLPPVRIMTPIDLGAHMLLFTPHSVVSAPYHRNQDGVRDTFRFFNEPIEAARVILLSRGIELVVVCPGMPELDNIPDAAPDSFARLLREDRLPDWLDETSPPGSTLRVFRVEGTQI